MELVNEFVVPRGIDETWAVLTDVERIAPAMPGATLDRVEDGKYHGTVKIKVGPVTAKYGGVASFRELDEVNHHWVLDATGKESNGRGRAAAAVTADLVPEGAETRVRVATDLTISGPLAQFGRGAIAEVSTRLLNQFVDNLKQTVLNSDSSAVRPAEPAPTTGNGSIDPTSTAPAPESATGTVPASTPATVPEPADASGPVGGVTAAGDSAGPRAGESAPEDASGTPGVTVAGSAEDPAAAAAGAPPAGSRQSAPAASSPPAAPAAEVNLLKVAAWPILKRLIPLIIVVVVVVVLLVWWLG